MAKNYRVPGKVITMLYGNEFLDVDRSVFVKTDHEKKRLKLLKERQNIKGRKWTTAISFNCQTQ